MKRIISFIISAVLLSSLFVLPTQAKTNEERSYDYNTNYGPYKSYDGKYEFAFASDIDDILYHNKGTALLCFFRGNDTSVIVPSTISGTTSATPIPASNISVSIIDSFCFAGSNIQYVRIPDGLKSINIGAFKDCLELKKVYLPENTSDIFLSSNIFENCICLESINIPNGVKRLPESLCYGCKNMTEVYLPSTLEEIYFNAFGDCEKISDVYFDGTKAEWDSIDIGTGNDYLLKARIHFNGTQEEQPTTEPTPQPSGNEFLYNNNNDGTCSVYDYIGNSENVIVPEKIDNLTVTEIAEGAFNNVDYADSERISDDKIKTISIPKTVSKIGSSAFVGCTNLQKYNVADQNPYYKAIDGVLFNYLETKLIAYPFGKTDSLYSIPGEVSEIGSYSFASAKIVNLVVPEAIKKVDNYAFANAKSLKNITYDLFLYDWNFIDVGSNNDSWRNADLYINHNLVKEKNTTISINDTWKFENLTDKIPDEIYNRVCPNKETVELLKQKTDGTGGQCYGMVGAIINIKDAYPYIDNSTISLYEHVGTNTSFPLADLGGDSVSNFIKTLYLLQFDSYLSDEEDKHSNRYDELINAVKNYKAGNGYPVLIAISIDEKNEKGEYENHGHALLATDISDGDNKTEISVYDCNYPNDSNRKIIIKKDSNGNPKSWSYVMASFLGIKEEWSSDKVNGKIKFNTLMTKEMLNMYGKIQNGTINIPALLKTNSKDFSITTQNDSTRIINGNTLSSPLKRYNNYDVTVDSEGKLIKKPSDDMYNISSYKTYTLSSKNNCDFSIADNGGFEFSCNADDKVTLFEENGEKCISYSSDSQIDDFSIRLFDDNYDVSLLCQGEETININPNQGNPIISGASEIEVNINDNKKKYFLDEDTEYIIKNDTYSYNLKEYYDENTGDINWNYDNSNNTLTITGNGNMSNYYRDYSAPWDEYKNTTKSIVVEEGVVSVGSYAFAGFSKVENVVIADSVKNIGSFAFSLCNSVKYLKAPCSAQWIDKNNVDYDGLNNIETLVFTKGSGKMRNFDTYGSPVCESRETLKKLTIEEGVKKIGSYVCYNCENLEEVNLPKSLTKSSDYAFSGCKNIKTVNYAGSLFEWCSINFAQIFGNPAYYAESLYIDGTELEGELVIPEGIIKLQSSTFENRDNITSVVFPNSLKTIGMGAFSDCDGLKEVVLSDNVEIIGKWAFEECDNIELFKANDNLKKLEDYAFYDCLNMKKVVITDIEKWCNIDFESNPLNASHFTVDLYVNDTIIKDLKIPDSISVIKKRAFSNSSIEHLYFGNNVKLIQEYAFSHCKILNTIVMMNSSTTIEKNSFIDCSNLSDVYYSGNEQEWDELTKDLKTNYAFPWEDNLVLANVQFNYNGSPINEPSYPTEPYIEDPTETNEIPPVTEPLEIPTVQPTTDESQIPSSLPSTDEPSNVPTTDPTEATTEKPNTTLPTESSEPVVEPTEPATKATSPLVTPTLKKRNNPMKVTVKTKSVKKNKLKSKKQTVKPLSITKAQGKYTVSLVKSGTTKKIRSKISVNKKGAITFKKGKYKKGTYKVKLKIYVKGNAYYKSKTVTKTVKIKIK